MSNQLLRRALVALSAVFALVVAMVAPASAQPEPFEGVIEELDFCLEDPDEQDEEICFLIPDPNGDGVCQETPDATLTITLDNIVEDVSADIVDVEIESGTFVELDDGLIVFAEFGEGDGASLGSVVLGDDPEVDVNVRLGATISEVTVVEPGECVVGPPICEITVSNGIDLEGDYDGDLPPPLAAVEAQGGGGPVNVDLFCDSDVGGQLGGRDAVVNNIEVLFDE